MNKIAVIGSGSMATALAKVLYDAGNKDIIIYGIEEKELTELKKGLNTNYFPDSTNLPNFVTTNKMSEAVKWADFILMAVPSVVADVVYSEVLANITSEVIIINAIKGFYPGTEEVIHTGLIKHSSSNKLVKGVVTLTGPSHAEEIVKEQITAVVATSKNKVNNTLVQDLFSNKYFRVYTQTDLAGAEIGSIYKNILAIGAGAINELGYGINTFALLVTRGMVEMSKLVKAFKGKESTAYGLTGLGDLIVTAGSPLSRNYRFGQDLARRGAKKALESKATIEGLNALKTMKRMASEKKLELPILNSIYAVVFQGSDVKKEVASLLSRPRKTEY